MNHHLSSNSIQRLLAAVGEVLEAAGNSQGIVIVGGADLNLRGWVSRTTRDVDVIARAEGSEGSFELFPPEPFPDPLREAIARVARDFGLPANWMNSEIGSQWLQGIPVWLSDDVEWRQFGGLSVGLAGRRTLIALKLYAAVDRGLDSVHYQDLLALQPTSAELREAGKWVIQQDAGTHFAECVEQTIRHVDRDSSRHP